MELKYVQACSLGVFILSMVGCYGASEPTEGSADAGTALDASGSLEPGNCKRCLPESPYFVACASIGEGSNELDVCLDGAPAACRSAADCCAEADRGLEDGACGGCFPPFSDCNGACVDIRADSQNCGGCGLACPVGQICGGGGCVSPAAEACNGVDDDSDGAVDEGMRGGTLAVPCDNGCGQMGTRTCQNGLLSDCTAPPPMPETCDGADNDCDGKIDEGVTKVFYADADGDSFGDPSLANAQTGCSAPPGGSFVENDQDCDDTDRLTFPGADENCADDEDNNCDREINDGCACPQVGATELCGSDEGLCSGGIRECTADGWSECSGDGIVEPRSEQCSGMDEDCDGMVDENLPDDQWEANETCENFRPLPDVQEDGEALIVDDAALYHANGETDHDWYRVTAEEGLGMCVPGFRECGLTLFVDFAVPETANDPSDYELCLHEIDDDECDGILQTVCTSDAGVATYDEVTGTFSFEVVWSGRCALDSSRDFLVEVRTPNDANLCQPYGLSLRFEDTEVECVD